MKNGTYAKVVSVGRRPVELDESIPQDKLVSALRNLYTEWIYIYIYLCMVW